MWKKIKNNLFMVKFLCKYSKIQILLTVLLGIFSLYELFVSINLLRYIINSLLLDDFDFKKIVFIIIASSIVSILINLFRSWYNNKYLPTMQIGFRNYLTKHIFFKTINVEMEALDNPEYYDNYAFMMDDTENRIFSAYNTFSNFILNIFKFILIISNLVVIFNDLFIVIFPVTTVIATTALLTLVKKEIYLRNMENLPINRKIDYIKRVLYLKEFAKSLRCTSVKNILINNMEESSRESKNIFTKYSKKITLLNLILSILFEFVGKVGVILYLIIKVINKGLLIGDFTGLYAASNLLTTNLQDITNSIHNIYENDMYIEKFKNFYSTIYNKKINNDIMGEDIHLKEKENFTIEFKNVSLCYNNNNNDALSNISFQIQKGQKIAIVGHNGAGKTSLINLLLKLYNPTKGRITVNDVDIADCNFEEYIKNFKIIPQDYNIFNLSVLENVLLNNNYTDMTIVHNALENVMLLKTIDKSKYGINSQIGREFDKDGIILSGGEYQKLALSRIFIGDAPIIVLDEPSSALDPVSEYQILKKIFETFKDETIIFVSHRLYTTTLSDLILVLDKGKIVEQGNHASLIEKNGIYKQLYDISTERYKVDL